MIDFPHTTPRMSWTFSNDVNAKIRRAAATGIYDIRGGGSKRRLPHFDDLLFLGASISRYRLEGYREKCATDVWLGTRHASKPIHLDIPVGADVVSIGTAGMIALGDNDPALEVEYNKLGTTAGAYDDWQEGRDPAGITTQDPVLAARLDPILGGRRLKNDLKVLTLEAQTIACACGKNHLHNLEPEDLCALTVESAAMAGVPLAGTSWIPGR